jgi:TP901 family phage tail tape measure protein
MAETVIRVTETGTRAVARQFGQVEKQLNRTGRAGARAGRAISGGLNRARAGVGRLISAAAGLGAAFTVRSIINFDEALARLQADAKLTNKETTALRSQILGLQKGFRVGKNDIAAALQVFQDFGGITKKGIPILGALTKRARATGTSMKDLATLASTFIQTMKVSPKRAVALIDMLVKQADLGQISMAKLATVMPELAAQASTLGLSVREIGAALQAVGQATGGNVDEARTSLVAMLNEIQAKAPQLKKTLGVNVFKIDPKTGKEALRSIEDIMSEVFKKTGGRLSGKKGLNAFFTNIRAKKAVAALLGQFDKETGRFSKKGTFGQVLAGKGDEKLINQKLKKLTSGVGAEADKVRGALFALDEQVQKLGKSALKFAAGNPLAALGIGVGGYAAFKGGGAVLGRLLAGRRGGGGGLGGGIGRPIPVYVVNNPAGATGPMQAAGKGGIGGTLAQATGALAAGVIASQVGQYAAQQKRSHVIKQLGEQAKVRSRQQGGVHVVRQAASLAALAKRGGTQFQGAGGKRVALTQENVMAALKASATRQGIDAETFKKMIPLLQGILAGVQKGTQVKVAPAGVGSLKTQRSRGGKQ